MYLKLVLLVFEYPSNSQVSLHVSQIYLEFKISVIHQRYNVSLNLPSLKVIASFKRIEILKLTIFLHISDIDTLLYKMLFSDTLLHKH